jgi:hypothetical protein
VLHDVSVAGAGLELGGRGVGIGDRVVFDLPLGDYAPATIQLTGEVRHATPLDDGVLRAGVEFVEVGDIERALVSRLVRDMEATPSPTTSPASD